MSLYLVTGVAGFIGSSIAEALLERGERVRGIDNFVTGKRENLAGLKGLDFIEGDLNSPEAVRKACDGVTTVFHEAAIPSVPRSVLDPVESNHANVNGTLRLLVAAKDAKVKRVVYAGSSSAYGDTPTLPKHEGMMPDPISPYAVSKVAGEFYMQSFYRVYGIETVTLRYFNVFGPRQDPSSPYSGVLAKWITQMLSDGPVVVFGDGEQSRDFTFIENVVRGNLLAASAPSDCVAGKVFNLATGERVTLNSVLSALKRITGYRRVADYAEERAGDIKHSHAEISRVKSALGYEPSVGFKEGLDKTVQWYRSQTVGHGVTATA
jgi:nucleoside-diphosphate-sugar epimerase